MNGENVLHINHPKQKSNLQLCGLMRGGGPGGYNPWVNQGVKENLEGALGNMG